MKNFALDIVKILHNGQDPYDYIVNFLKGRRCILGVKSQWFFCTVQRISGTVMVLPNGLEVQVHLRFVGAKKFVHIKAEFGKRNKYEVETRFISLSPKQPGVTYKLERYVCEDGKCTLVEQ